VDRRFILGSPNGRTGTIINFPGKRKTAHDSAVKTTECLTDNEVGELSEDEEGLLENYRHSTLAGRTTLQRLATRLLQRCSKT
jgi:predicted nucleic acid-binding protein